MIPFGPYRRPQERDIGRGGKDFLTLAGDKSRSDSLAHRYTASIMLCLVRLRIPCAFDRTAWWSRPTDEASYEAGLVFAPGARWDRPAPGASGPAGPTAGKVVVGPLAVYRTCRPGKRPADGASPASASARMPAHRISTGLAPPTPPARSGYQRRAGTLRGIARSGHCTCLRARDKKPLFQPGRTVDDRTSLHCLPNPCPAGSWRGSRRRRCWNTRPRPMCWTRPI